MGKRLIAILALALIVGLTYGAAYAEVQNVKVSGDIKIIGVARNNFTLGNPADGNPAIVTRTPYESADGPALATTKEDDKSRFIATQTRVRIDADLTDNVMATVRLINERVWTGESISSTDIDLDLAYVTLKEFLYSPLTLTLGRQEIRFGNQLIIGSAGTYSTANPGPLNGLPEDLSVRNAFDALRATLNYDPLVIDLVYAKTRNINAKPVYNLNASNDTDLFGINASFDITKKVNVQAYVWDRKDKSAPVNDNNKDDIYTIGALISVMPIEGFKTSLESAWQYGKTRGRTGSLEESRNAWAIQALADYTFTKLKFSPSIGASYTYLTGGSDKNGWNPMYYNQALNPIAYAIFPFTNLSVINLRGSVKPMEDVTLSANYGNYRLVNGVSSFNTAKADGNGNYYTIITGGKKELGNELDLGLTYDYTEDVQIGLSAGWFFDGSAIQREARDATQLMGSMKVSF
jgi:hypothetical protein